MRSRKETRYYLVLLTWTATLALGCSGPGESLDDDDSSLEDEDSEVWRIHGTLSRSVEAPGDAVGPVFLMVFDTPPSPEGGTPPVYWTGFNAQLDDIDSTVSFALAMPEVAGGLHLFAFLDDDLSSNPPSVEPDEGDLLALDPTTFQPAAVDLAGLAADDLALELVLNWVM